MTPAEIVLPIALRLLDETPPVVVLAGPEEAARSVASFFAALDTDLDDANFPTGSTLATAYDVAQGRELARAAKENDCVAPFIIADAAEVESIRRALRQKSREIIVLDCAPLADLGPDESEMIAGSIIAAAPHNERAIEDEE